MNQRKIRIIDIVASRLLEEFDSLIDAPGADDEPTEIIEIGETEGSSSKTSDLPNW